MRWLGIGCACAAGLWLGTASVAAAAASDLDGSPEPIRIAVDDATESSVVSSALHELSPGTAKAIRDGTVELRPMTRAGAHRGARVIEVGGRWRGIPLAAPLARVVAVHGETDAGEAIVVEHASPSHWPEPGMLAVNDEAQALGRVAASGLPGALGALRADLRVDVSSDVARLVWVVDPPADLQGGTNPVFWVDAADGSVHVHHDKTADAWVRSFRRNPALDNAQEFELFEIDAGTKALRGPSIQAMGCVPAQDDGLCEPAALAQADGAGDFLYPAPNVDVFADNVDPYDPFDEASAYYHGDAFLRWVGNLGFAGLVCNKEGQVATVVTNVRTTFNGGAWTGYNNARFTGDCEALILLGQGQEVDFALDGDIVAHELGHAVVEGTMAGGWLSQPRRRRDAMVHDAAALNEAVADFLSSAHAKDPIVGDYIGAYWDAINLPGVRVNKHNLRCPDALTGQEHVDSEPFAGALWDIWRRLGDPFVSVVLDTVAVLPDDASMEQASAVLIEVTALELGGNPAQIVRNELLSRNLLSCRRIVPYDGLRGPLHVEPPEGWVDPYTPPPLQLEVPIDDDVDTLELTFAAIAEEDDDGGIEPGILIRQGVPFSFDYDTSVEPPLLVHDADFVREELTQGRVVLPVIPGEPLYVAFVNTGSATMEVFGIEANTWWEGHGHATTSAGTDSAASSTESDTLAGTDSITDTLDLDPPTKGGCLCRAEGSRGTAQWWMFLGLLLLARRRQSSAVR